MIKITGQNKLFQWESCTCGPNSNPYLLPATPVQKKIIHYIIELSKCSVGKTVMLSVTETWHRCCMDRVKVREQQNKYRSLRKILKTFWGPWFILSALVTALHSVGCDLCINLVLQVKQILHIWTTCIKEFNHLKFNSCNSLIKSRKSFYILH